MRTFLPLLLVLLASCADRSLPRRPAADVIREHSAELMEIEHVRGVYEGKDDRGDACIVIMVDALTPAVQEALPQTLGGYPVRIHETGEIVPQH